MLRLGGLFLTDCQPSTGSSAMADVVKLLSSINRCMDVVPRDGNSLFECFARQTVHESLKSPQCVRQFISNAIACSKDVLKIFLKTNPSDQVQKIAEDKSWHKEWESFILSYLAHATGATIMLLESGVNPKKYAPPSGSNHSYIYIVKYGDYYISTKAKDQSTNPEFTNRPEQQGIYCK